MKFLNRKLNKVVMIDVDDNSFSKEGLNNLVTIPNYEGAETDDTLVHLRRFLVHLAKKEVKDVRTEIKKYGGYNVALSNYQKEYAQRVERYKNSLDRLSGKRNN